MICNKLKGCVDAHFAEPVTSVSCVNVHAQCIEFYDDRPQLKCDNVIAIKDEPREVIFVELKGENVGHALKQLEATIRREAELVRSCGKVYARIVLASAVPKLQTTKAYVDLQKLVLQKGGNIKTRSLNFEEKDTDLDTI